MRYHDHQHQSTIKAPVGITQDKHCLWVISTKCEKNKTSSPTAMPYQDHQHQLCIQILRQQAAGGALTNSKKLAIIWDELVLTSSSLWPMEKLIPFLFLIVLSLGLCHYLHLPIPLLALDGFDLSTLSTNYAAMQEKSRQEKKSVPGIRTWGGWG